MKLISKNNEHASRQGVFGTKITSSYERMCRRLVLESLKKMKAGRLILFLPEGGEKEYGKSANLEPAVIRVQSNRFFSKFHLATYGMKQRQCTYPRKRRVRKVNLTRASESPRSQSRDQHLQNTFRTLIVCQMLGGGKFLIFEMGPSL